MSERDSRWSTLSEVVDWVRRIHPTATIGEIRAALQGWCAADRIRAHGRRRLYSSDRALPMGHYDPDFVLFADHHRGEVGRNVARQASRPRSRRTPIPTAYEV